MPNFTSMLQFLNDPRPKMLGKSCFCSILQHFAAFFLLVPLWLWAWNFVQSCYYSRRFFGPNLTALGVLMAEWEDRNGLFQKFWRSNHNFKLIQTDLPMLWRPEIWYTYSRCTLECPCQILRQCWTFCTIHVQKCWKNHVFAAFCSILQHFAAFKKNSPVRIFFFPYGSTKDLLRMPKPVATKVEHFF